MLPWTTADTSSEVLLALTVVVAAGSPHRLASIASVMALGGGDGVHWERNQLVAGLSPRHGSVSVNCPSVRGVRHVLDGPGSRRHHAVWAGQKVASIAQIDVLLVEGEIVAADLYPPKD